MFKLAQAWHQSVPIRIRLTVWYLLSLSTILVAAAIFIHTRIQDGLQAQVDQALELAASQARSSIIEENGKLVFQPSASLDDLSDDFTLSLVAPDGTIWDRVGDDDTAPVLLSATNGHFTFGKNQRRHGQWRIYNQTIPLADGSVLGRLQVAQRFDLDNLLGLLRRHFFLSLPLGLTLAGLGGIFLATRALRPIDQITRTAQAITADGLQQRIHYDGPPDEIGRLAATFDQMLDRLQAGFERERRFAGDAAHELRTPLTALKGQIEVTLSQPRRPEDYQHTLGDLNQQVDRLIRLSNDLLFMTRLDHQMERTQPEAIELNILLAILRDQVRPLAESKAQTLAEVLPPNLAIYGHMDLLIRLFLNLLDNAIKYTPQGGTITLRAEKQPSQVCVSISDTGPGIAPEHLPHLFERFYRGESDRARYANGQPGGAGLGLAIAQEIAHAHGGSLTVRSTPGQGSTFVVCLPLEK